MRDLHRSERGFSLIETLVVAALGMVLLGMAVVQMRTARATMVADNAMRLVMNELARARDMAIQRRRFIQVNFVGVNEMRLVRRGIAPEPLATLVHGVIMEGNLRFALPAGTPDTSDAFGAGGPLDFDGTDWTGDVCFNAEGMLVQCSTGNTINGTIFLAAPADQYATRAVTILGSTGRVRGFRRLNSTWGRV